MSILIGFDLVDCIRCAHWLTFSPTTLMRIFSPEEIAYCCSEPTHSASRFAVRFAAREALYKALSTLQQDSTRPMPFRHFCKSVHVVRQPGQTPCFTLNHDILEQFYNLTNIVNISLSLSHTPTTAGAVVMIMLIYPQCCLDTLNNKKYNED